MTTNLQPGDAVQVCIARGMVRQEVVPGRVVRVTKTRVLVALPTFPHADERWFGLKTGREVGQPKGLPGNRLIRTWWVMDDEPQRETEMETTYTRGSLTVVVKGGKVVFSNVDYAVVGCKANVRHLRENGFKPVAKASHYDAWGRPIR